MEVSRELVVAGRDATPVLEATEGAFDHVSLLVGVSVEWVDALARGVVGDNGQRPALDQELAQSVAVVGSISGASAARRQLTEKLRGGSNIAKLALRHFDRDRTSERVADCMDLGCASAAGTADSLRFRPPFPPAAERCALAVVESILWKASSETSRRASNNRRQTARRDHRFQRL